jgi:hypothetical protein
MGWGINFKIYYNIFKLIKKYEKRIKGINNIDN